MTETGTTLAALAYALGEPPRTYKYLARIIQTLGREKIEDYLKRADALYNAGSLLTKDGSRKRSLGGTFFYLVRQDYPELAQ